MDVDSRSRHDRCHNRHVPTYAAVVGSPIEHSLSPVLHFAAYRALGLSDWRYELRDVAAGHLGEFVDSLDDSWVGLSVTMPLKREALALASTASATAVAIGAANTLLATSTGWRADNTDGDGLVDALRLAGVGQPRQLAIVGAGGTAQASIYAAAHLDAAEVIVGVRDIARADAALRTADACGVTVSVRSLAEAAEWLPDADVVVSTVPAGAADALGEVVAGSAVVCDVVYSPWPTVFAATAAARGARVLSGLDMLLHQAARQVALMTGMPAPLTAMRYALSERTGVELVRGPN